MKDMLKWGIYIGLFAILFIPFIVANAYFFPFITGKAFAFRIITEIIFTLWVMLALYEPAYRPKKTTLLYALLAFTVSIGISTVLAENPSKSFWSNFERMEGYISLLHFGAYFLVISSVFQTRKLWNTFWNTSIGVSALVALYGVMQLAGTFPINQGGVRVDATFGNASYLAVYMLFHFFITLLMLVEARAKKMPQILYAVALVLQALMVFYTATRGSILGLIGGLFLSGLIFVVFAKGQKKLRQFGAVLALGLVVVAGLFVAMKDNDLVRDNPVLTRIASISLEEGKTRFTIWGMAWEGFLERPVFGWGQENFNYIFNKYYRPSLYGQEPWFDRAHNIFFDWLVAGGFVGFALYLSLFGVILWYLWRKDSEFDLVERALITGLLAGYSFHNFFVFDNLMSYVLFFSLLGYVAVRNGRGELVTNTEYSAAIKNAGAAVAVIVFAVVLYVANIPGMTRAAGMIDAIRPYQEGTTRNFEQFKKVIGTGGIGRQEAHEQLIQFAAQLRSQQFASATTPEFRDQVAEYALGRFTEEIERTPNDARLRIFLGSFLRQVGLVDQGEVEIQKAHELSPQKQSIIFELGILETNRGNFMKAMEYFKEAFELDTSYDMARSFYASSAVRAGREDIGEALMEERYGTRFTGDPYVLQAYIDIGESEKVVQIAEARVAENPASVEARVQLAGAYLEVGRKQDAIQSLRDAIDMDPQFKLQGEQYISDIEAGRL